MKIEAFISDVTDVANFLASIKRWELNEIMQRKDAIYIPDSSLIFFAKDCILHSTLKPKSN